MRDTDVAKHMARGARKSRDEGARPSDLARLLEVERAVEARIAAAREQASRLVEQAKKDVERLESEAEAELVIALERIEAERRARHAHAIDEIAARAQAEAQAFEAISDERARALAVQLIAWAAGASEIKRHLS